VSYNAGLAEPISEVRDVIETFRRYGIRLTDWRQILSTATERLEQLPVSTAQPGTSIPRLTAQLRNLVEFGLVPDDPTLKAVATEVESLTVAAKVPGMPSPNDERWEF
jgi:hypothetical protein